MLWLKSFVFTIIFYLYTLFLCILLLPTLVSRRASYLLPTVWAWSVPYLIRFFCGIRIKVEGLENIPKGRGYIVASKHQSALETIILFNYVPKLLYILKRELLLVPVASWYFIRMKYIFIDRSGGAKTMRSMTKAAKERLNEGMNLGIFPEGTRTAPGTKKPYNPGVAFLYDQLKVPVLPVAVNTGHVWPKNKIIKHAGVATIKFLPVIPSGLDKRVFLDRLYNEIETAQDTWDKPCN